MKSIIYCIETRKKHDWENLPAKYQNANRNFEHFLSRYAISRLIKKEEQFQQLELKAYQFIEQYPKNIFSIAHTRTAAFAITANDKDFLAIGCDIESRTRKIPKNSEKHFINEYDQLKHLDLLDTWCIKEACFKALSNAGVSIKLLKEVVLLEDHRFHFLGETHSHFVGQYTIINHLEYILVIAHCSQAQAKVNYISL